MLLTLDHLEGTEPKNISSMSQRIEHILTCAYKKIYEKPFKQYEEKKQFNQCKPKLKKYRNVQELGKLERKSTQTRISHN